MAHLKLQRLLRQLVSRALPVLNVVLGPKKRKRRGREWSLSQIYKLPTEILFMVSSLLSFRDVQSLSLTCSTVRLSLQPVLFRAVKVDSLESLESLASHRRVSRNIQKLELGLLPYRLDNTALQKHNAYDLDHRVSRDITSMVQQRNLSLLSCLEWKGPGLPPDVLWAVLRSACPTLREISLQVDDQLPGEHSSLWTLTGLTSFNLTVCDTATAFRGESFPDAMWNMLVFCCPGLQSLTLKTPKSRPIDCKDILRGKWGHLSYLSIAIRAYDHDFVGFLASHPKLRRLDLEWIGAGEHRTSTEAADAGQPLEHSKLPSLRSFSGNLHFANKVLTRPEDVGELDVSYTTLLPRDIPGIGSFLSSFTTLTSLTIGLLFFNPHDHTSIFSVLSAACPALGLLHIIGNPALPLRRIEEAALELRRLTFLRVFQLSEQKCGRCDDFMSDIAGRIARRRHPHLEEVRITWAPDPSSKRGFTKKGRYRIVLNSRGDPAKLLAEEVQSSRQCSKRKTRQYRYNISIRRAMWERPGSGSSVHGFLI